MASANEVDYKTATSIYDFTVKDTYGKDVSLDKYRGNVVLIVNIASQCGLTKNNYAKLTQLHKDYYDKGERHSDEKRSYKNGSNWLIKYNFQELKKNKSEFFNWTLQVYVFWDSHAINSPDKCQKLMAMIWFVICRRKKLNLVTFLQR